MREIYKRLQLIQDSVALELHQALFEKKKKNVYVHMATGSGKTELAIKFMFDHYVQKDKKVLVLSHNWFLIEQFLGRMMKIKPGFDFKENCGYWGSEHNANLKNINGKIDSLKDRSFEEEVNVLFTTHHSMYSTLCGDKREKPYKELKGYCPDLIIIDEAHWGKRGDMEDIIFKFIEDNYPRVKIVGLTATPKTRRGWEKVGNVYFKDLVECKLLATPEVVPVKINSGLTYHYDNVGMLMNESEILHDEKRNELIAQDIRKNISSTGKTLIFAGDTFQAQELERMLRQKGLSVTQIHSKVDSPSQALRSFASKDSYSFDVAVTVFMLSEGIDIPEIDTVVIARPVTSEIQFAQIVGRGCRKTFLAPYILWTLS